MENENVEANGTENPTPETGSLKQELQLREEKIAALEKTLADKEGEIAAMKKSLDEAKQVIVETAVDLSEAIGAYRELAGQANPGPVAEMIKGETIAEINASLKSARETVEKVRRDMDAENARVRVPAGAPQRTAPDLSALTPREKIRYGMEKS